MLLLQICYLVVLLATLTLCNPLHESMLENSNLYDGSLKQDPFFNKHDRHWIDRFYDYDYSFRTVTPVDFVTTTSDSRRAFEQPTPSAGFGWNWQEEHKSTLKPSKHDPAEANLSEAKVSVIVYSLAIGVPVGIALVAIAIVYGSRGCRKCRCNSRTRRQRTEAQITRIFTIVTASPRQMDNSTCTIGDDATVTEISSTNPPDYQTALQLVKVDESDELPSYADFLVVAKQTNCDQSVETKQSWSKLK